jgi:hypothetical protein
MLTPFTQKDAKVSKRGREGRTSQLNLWSVRLGAGRKPSSVHLEQHNLREIAVLWTPEMKKLDLPQVAELRARCGALADSLAGRLSSLFAEMKKKGLNRPSDVAAYLTLRELDDKGRRELPGSRLKVLDFGIEALVKE